MNDNDFNDMLDGSIDTLIRTFGCNKYEAEKIYTNVRMELVVLTEEFNYDWSHDFYNVGTHLLIHIQIDSMNDPSKYEEPSEIAEYIKSIDLEVIKEVIEKSS